MGFKASCLIAVTLFFSMGLKAEEPRDSGASRAQVVKNYNALKSKVDRGEKVRVIAWVKGVEKGKPGHKSVPPGLERAKENMENRGIKAQRQIPRLGILVFEVDAHALDALVSSGHFQKIEEDIPQPPTLVESTEIIGADLTRRDGFSGRGQAVVILDTGVESWHPFYSDRLVEEACFSSNTSNSSSLCPNGQETQTGANAANDCSATGIPSCDHGTHVAGIAAGDDGAMHGVAPDASIVAVQVFSEFPASYPSCGGERCVLSYTSDQLAALEWVLNDSATRNIASINMSLGGGSYASACDSDSRAGTIADLRSAGIATVIASGNNGSSDSVGAPGCISSAVTTGSTRDTSDSVSSFSNSSSLVDILAPGSWITSSIVGGGFGIKSGTSMAAPHVAGAFAVMRAINPSASVDDIEQSLKSHGVPVLDSRNDLTFPRLDLHASVMSFEGVPISSLDKNSYSVIVDRETEFTAYSSSDPNGRPLTYIWGFGDGVSGYQTSTAKVQHTYTNIGSYDLTLSVTNGDKYSDPNDMATVTVYDPALIAIITSSILF